MKLTKLTLSFLAGAAMSSGQIAYAQAPAAKDSPASRYETGLMLEHRGDEKGAFIAFLEAAEAGNPPAQRKLGEIYDSGNTVVKRDYQAAIRWYEKAREGGEILPPLRSPYPNVMNIP